MGIQLSRPKNSPSKLKTPPGSSEYTTHTDEKDGKKILVCKVGSTIVHYDARCIDDLHAMLKKAGNWVELGSADEQKPTKEGTVESWGWADANPIGGWYGLKRGLRGRFGVYIPLLMEELGLCEREYTQRTTECASSEPSDPVRSAPPATVPARRSTRIWNLDRKNYESRNIGRRMSTAVRACWLLASGERRAHTRWHRVP